MLLLQITGVQGGDTVLVVVPDQYDKDELLAALDADGVEFQGDPVIEFRVDLGDAALNVDLYSVFVQVC